MAVIGLTGGIATGKSTVARLLRERGVPVIDADVAARAVVAPGSPGMAALIEAFGVDIILPSGELDRASMRARIVADAAAKSTLEQITHPAIRSWVAERVQAAFAAGHSDVVVEAALLVETGGYRLYPILIVVSCDPKRQVSRVMARDQQTADAARAIIATQLPMSEKEVVATYVIRNDGDLAALEQSVGALWESIRSDHQ